MIPCRGESTDGEPEDSRWSVIVHHSSPIELKAVKVSRAKWVKVLEVRIECPVSPGVIEVMHLQLRVRGQGYILCPGRGGTVSPVDFVMPSREDA